MCAVSSKMFPFSRFMDGFLILLARLLLLLLVGVLGLFKLLPFSKFDCLCGHCRCCPLTGCLINCHYLSVAFSVSSSEIGIRIWPNLPQLSPHLMSLSWLRDGTDWQSVKVHTAVTFCPLVSHHRQHHRTQRILIFSLSPPPALTINLHCFLPPEHSPLAGINQFDGPILADCFAPFLCWLQFHLSFHQLFSSFSSFVFSRSLSFRIWKMHNCINHTR